LGALLASLDRIQIHQVDWPRSTVIETVRLRRHVLPLNGGAFTPNGQVVSAIRARAFFELLTARRGHGRYLVHEAF
jgi:hypothetical protein